MRLSDLDYELPAHLIAQHPCAERDQARLLVVDRTNDTIDHRRVLDLPDLLRQGDLLVLNDSRVLPARLFGKRSATGGRFEGLFLRATPEGLWEMLTQTRGRLRSGELIDIEPGPLQLRIVGRDALKHWLLEPVGCKPGSHVRLLEKHGQVPLPPYIRKGKEESGDRDRYQTIFAREAGSAAAPTAGLHFTERLFERLAKNNITREFVTLHVGVATFQPIQVEDVALHPMHAEWATLPEETAAAIRRCKRNGGRVIAVGTTTVRVLESTPPGEMHAWSDETRLFIHPPFSFRHVDALITNFHLPRSSLLLLVAAFANMEKIRRAYRVAVENDYRFFSYGDAMLLI